MRLGILGGTFNPIHLGHLILAEGAREQCALDQVWFVPTAIPPHKPSRDLLDGRRRLALVRLAIRGHPDFLASDLELARGGVSYTLHTVEAIRRRRPHAKLFLIIGSEMLRVPWYGFDELKRLCTFVVAERPSGLHARPAPGPAIGPRPLAVGPSDALQRAGGRDVAPRGAQGEGSWGLPVGLHMRRISIPQVALSSSMIRARIQRRQSIRYLVPDAVARSISRLHLFKS